jgi:hypothetical protein
MFPSGVLFPTPVPGEIEGATVGIGIAGLSWGLVNMVLLREVPTNLLLYFAN